MFYGLPSLSTLRALEAAVRLGSFKAAAEELSVTRTAISHLVRKLEDHLGVGLFVRRTRAVEPTDSGERLAAAVHRAFAEILPVVEHVAEGERVLTVTTTPAFASLWLAPRLARFHEAHPDIRVRLEADTAPVDLRRDRRIDIAIRYGPGTVSDLEVDRLPAEFFGAYAAPDCLRHLEDGGRTILFETVWRRPDMDRPTWAQWLAEAGANPLPGAHDLGRFDQEHHVVQCGIAGQGLILASSILVTDLVDRGFLVPYRAEVQLKGLRYSLLATRTRRESKKVRRFVDWIREESRSAPGA